MLIFTNDLGDMQNLSDKYKKSGETASLSLPIEFQNKKYREIIYRKTSLGKSKNINGIVFLSEDGKVVTDSKIEKELLNLSFYMETTLDDKCLEDFNKAIASEMEIKKEIWEYRVIIDGFEELKDNGAENLENFMEILIKLPELKVESNEVIQKYFEAVNSYKIENFVFNKVVMDDIMPLYRKVLLKNIERVKYVNRGRNYYDDLKDKATKIRKKYRWKFTGRGGIEPILKLEDTISYFKKMLSVYEQVLTLSEAQYLKYIKNIENQSIEERQKLIRK